MKAKPQTIAMPDVVRRVVAPRARMTVSRWANDHPFEIAEKGAAQPGPYDLNWTPFWREPLDAMGDPAVRNISVVASSQVGKTQIGNVMVAWYALNRPANMLYVRPNDDDVAEAFRDRFSPMIQRNLPGLLPAGDWMTITKNPVITLTNMIIYGAAATIPRQLTSRTTPLVWFDEVDSGGADRNELGNVLALLDERQMALSAYRSLTVGTSTPKYDTGPNWVAFDQHSDARQYWEPCPLCGRYQPLVMANIRAPDGERDAGLIRDQRLAWYSCHHCRGRIDPHWQDWMSDRGVWVRRGATIDEPLPLDDDGIRDHRSLALAPDETRWEPQILGSGRDNPHRGYHLWRANTKFEQCSWSHIIARWFEVSKTKDPQRVQVFVNNWLAEPWRDAIKAADEQMVRSRIGQYEARVVPTRVKVILGAIDVQHDCLWFVFRGFGPDQESWLIDYGTVEVTNQDFGSALETVYRRAIEDGWPIAGDQNLSMRAYAMAVDSGFRTDEVYAFSRRGGVIAVKGEDTAAYRVRVSKIEGKDRPDPVNLYRLNTKAFKDRLQRMVHTPTGDPGSWNLHRDTTDEYVMQLTSEHLVQRSRTNKARIWRPKAQGRPNHLLDCECYTLGLSEALEQRREVSLIGLRETDPALGVFRRGGNSAAGIGAITGATEKRQYRRVNAKLR